MTTDTIREQFLNFFKSKKHRVVSSDSLVPADDPTVLFTPAGMNQFKKEFLGYDSGFKRATTSQRCLRTDDLEKVGKTSVHHTFFEMLGNFSFGDYSKNEAIVWAWEFLTRELKISKDKLWVSVYEDDDEAYLIWKDVIKVPSHKILKLGDKDNFWPSEAKDKGPNGPCGPCSEIFFDFKEEAGCGKSGCNPTCSCGRYAEIWNLVFTQFNRKEGGILEPLPQKNIDTGMGLERLTAVMEGVTNNFETSLFGPLVKEISLKAAVTGSKKEDLYAIADHIRAVTFCIYDGALPSNEARGYVVRKLIRKSTLHLRNLGIKQAFLYKLIPQVASIMHGYYPDLKVKQENIAQIVQAEENNFLNTLISSEQFFKERFGCFLEKNDPEKAGQVAFELHDTYGIPFDLTRQWLKKHSIAVSEGAFEKSLQEQKDRSKLQSAMKGDVFVIKDLDLGLKATQFIGYKEYSSKSKIVKILKDNKEVKKAVAGEEVKIILEKTPFYAESGGQVNDIGSLVKGKNCFEVIDTQKSGKVFVHIGKIKSGSFKKYDYVSAVIDIQRRLSIARNHTATHLLQAALRKVLGAHVQQQGSLVAPDRFRFDFTHFKGLDRERLDRVESLVNEYVISNIKVESKEMTLAQAKKTKALAFFGEKYEGKVRVVTVQGVSKEFCGGTHLSQTGQIGLFKILQEGSVASGVRRIEGCTGIAAYQFVKKQINILEEISTLLNVCRENTPDAVKNNQFRIKALEKELNSQKLASMQSAVGSLDKEAEEINGIRFVVKDYPDADMGLLRKAADAFKNSASSKTIGVLSSTAHNRINLVVVVSPDLCNAGASAAGLIKEMAPLVGGSGGGRPDFAQAGGSKPENLKDAIEKCRSIIAQIKI